YARAMSAWSGILAIGGVSYYGGTRSVTAPPRLATPPFPCIWSASDGWGLFSYSGPNGAPFPLRAVEGSFFVKSVTLRSGPTGSPAVKIGNRSIGSTFSGPGRELAFAEEITVKPGEDLLVQRG